MKGVYRAVPYTNIKMTKKYRDLRDILKKIEKEYMDEVGFIYKVKGDI